jgi:hypothetical protein
MGLMDKIFSMDLEVAEETLINITIHSSNNKAIESLDHPIKLHARLDIGM